jgi:hypothetical protein
VIIKQKAKIEMDMPKINFDASQIKKVFSRLTFIRNYSSYILPLVLIAVAVILFVVNRLMSGGLKNKIQKESIQLGRSINSYLPQEISSRQWRVEKQYQDKLEADANSISALERQTTQRELLSYNLFPEPTDTSSLIFEQYGRKYRQSIEDLITSYRARGCPTPMEIARAVRQFRPGGSEVAVSPSYIRNINLSSMNKAELMIVDELCLEAARKASFYVEPYDVAGYEYWGMEPTRDVSGDVKGVVSGGEVYQYRSIEQSVQACWYWQLGYWIIEDVFKTIGAMNRQCDNVMDCPVKRLMEISFVSEDASVSAQAGVLSRAPEYVRQEENKETTAVHTGHSSNDKIDVVHFRIVVIIDPQSALGFMEELCSVKEHTFRGWSGDQPSQNFLHNQITVLEVNINPININTDGMIGSEADHQFYRYGDDGVSEMELLCEYIFEKAGYDKIEPETVKNQPIQENL